MKDELAKYAHDAWSGWMKYMFSKCGKIDLLPGGLFIPSELVERWTRQMNTEYEDLPENEKESDRKEANEILNIINK